MSDTRELDELIDDLHELTMALAAVTAERDALRDEIETARDNAATWKAETFQNFNRAKEAETERDTFRNALARIGRLDNGPSGKYALSVWLNNTLPTKNEEEAK